MRLMFGYGCRRFTGLSWLFMGAANSDAKLYDDEIQAIARTYPDQFRVDYALSREQKNKSGGERNASKASIFMLCVPAMRCRREQSGCGDAVVQCPVWLTSESGSKVICWGRHSIQQHICQVLCICRPRVPHLALRFCTRRQDVHPGQGGGVR